MANEIDLAEFIKELESEDNRPEDYETIRPGNKDFICWMSKEKWEALKSRLTGGKQTAPGWQNHISRWDQIPFVQLEEYTYVGGEPISDIPSDAKSFLCFTTKSGDYIRLPLVLQRLILTKEFLDMIKTYQEPVPGFPGLTFDHKMVWFEVDYKPSAPRERSEISE